MNDPYGPIERTYRLTGRALEVIAQHRFPVHILTKSDLVTRDLAVLQDIAAVYAVVTFTLTTTDDALAAKLEPGAPPPSARLAAMRALSAAGIPCGVSMMPILPFIEDNVDNIAAIVARAHDAGGRHIIPWFGMSMRDRQRAYYYARLDQLFPGLRRRYEAAYGERYICPAPNAERLACEFEALCARVGMATRVRPYSEPERPVQLALP
jgi:DNA repair photolyase